MSVPYLTLAGYRARAQRSFAFSKATLGMCLAVFVLISTTASPAAAGQDRVKWMAQKLLSGKDIIDYETAINKFSSISDTRILPTLKKLTESSDVIPRAESAGVLWRYNSKEVRKLLVGLTEDNSPEVKIEAAKSLCLMKYAASLPVIIEALKSKDAKVRARAFRALAKINSQESKAAVLARKPGRTQIDRIWIAYALHSMGEKPTEQLAVIERRLLSIPASALLAGKSDPDEEDLERAARLATKGTDLRLHATSALSRIASEEALNLLVIASGDLALADNPLGPRRQLRRHGNLAALALASGLRNEKVLVRMGSASVAGQLRLGSNKAPDSLSTALGKCLSDESRLVRLACAQAIGDLGLRSQSGLLGKALKHEDPDTRRAAIKAFGTMNLSSSVEPLLELLGSEKNPGIRRNIYKALAKIGSATAVDPLFRHLKQLHTKGQKQRQFADEIPLCLDALAAGGDKAAIRALELLPKVDKAQRKLMTEILARSGSSRALGFFIDSLRDNVPDPDGPEVRFFDSLDAQMVPQLEKMIGDETAMWIRVILARTLYKLGKKEYARGIKWGLKNEDAYMRKLAAAVSQGVVDTTNVKHIIHLLEDDSRTARFAARALLSAGSPRAIEGFLGGIKNKKLRQRRTWPVIAFWDGQSSAAHPFSKEVDNDRVWVVYAEDRLGRELDLFITWSADGRVWKEPAFTGLTSFADPGGQVPPPTFSLKVRGREITIALTRTFAQSANANNPNYKTLQRVHRFKLKDFFKDKDGDDLKNLEEKIFFTNPAREDSDQDGIPDGQDNNPLAKPADITNDQDVLKLLAFSYALLVKNILPGENRLLVVANEAGVRKAPELVTFPGLVLHLNKEQIRTQWKTTGCGFPRIVFKPTRINHNKTKATQVFYIISGIDDQQKFKVSFVRRDGQWKITGFED